MLVSGRSPHGERGLKSAIVGQIGDNRGRSPHGERGLKYMQNGRQTPDSSVALLMESVD